MMWRGARAPRRTGWVRPEWATAGAGAVASLGLVGTYLDRILEHHRDVAAADARPLGPLLDAAAAGAGPRGFEAALRHVDGGRMAVIAEVKRRSPSRGDLAADLDPAGTAAAYVRGGASCLSVLTDATFFGGSPEDLRRAREAVAVPVLRKDFTVDPRDLCDAALMGADAVLLIAAVLDDRELVDLHQLAAELGLDALVEVHDEAEAERALAAGAGLIGVNQRDLRTFEVDTRRACRVAASIPGDVVKVAESGIGAPGDIPPLQEAGYGAVLVGESLVTSGDPCGAVAALASAGSGGGSAG